MTDEKRLFEEELVKKVSEVEEFNGRMVSFLFLLFQFINYSTKIIYCESIFLVISSMFQMTVFDLLQHFNILL